MPRTELQPLDEQATHVYRLLGDLSASLMERSFQRYADLISLPFIVATRGNRFVYATRDELRRTYDVWQRTIQAHDATGFAHKVHNIDRLGQNGLIVDYDTDLMANDKLALPTFKNFLFLRPQRGRWQIEQMVSGVSNERPSLFIKVDPDHATPEISPPPPPQGPFDAED